MFHNYSSTLKKFSGEKDQTMREEIYAYHLEFMNKISQKLTGRTKLFKNECILEIDLCNRLKTCAGMAYCECKTIRINYHFHKRNPNQLRNTYGHELAHILTHILYGDKVRDHGKEWKAIMNALNLKSEARYDQNLFE